ncbi:DNA-binding protein [Paenibacillus sp. SI8]|uniref:DNA-binding protein n=1 Tax=unclassified Paenibacillus TaxID=185978 RepID=UPI00346752EB
MSRITEEMVFKAANEIDLEGKTPRVPDIRTKLGSGSYSTIQTYLKKWKETQKVDELDIKEEAPEAIKSRLDAFTTQIWNIAIEMANERLRGEREALEEVKKEMEEQQKETAETADQLAAELEKVEELLKETNTLLEIEKQNHETTRNMLQHETDQVIKLTVQVESNARHIEDLKQSEKASRNLLEETNRNHKKECEGLHSQITKINNEKIAIEERHKADVKLLSENLEKAHNAEKSASEETKKAQALAQATQIEAATLNGQINSLKDQVEKQNKIIADSLKIVPSKNNNNKPKTTDPSQ